jgi:hypothetical protein
MQIHNLNIHDAQSKSPLPHLHGKQWTFCIGECAHDETNTIFSSPHQPLGTTTTEPVPFLRHSCLKNKKRHKVASVNPSCCRPDCLIHDLLQSRCLIVVDCCIQPGMTAL